MTIYNKVFIFIYNLKLIVGKVSFIAAVIRVVLFSTPTINVAAIRRFALQLNVHTLKRILQLYLAVHGATFHYNFSRVSIGICISFINEQTSLVRPIACLHLFTIETHLLLNRNVWSDYKYKMHVLGIFHPTYIYYIYIYDHLSSVSIEKSNDRCSCLTVLFVEVL